LLSVHAAIFNATAKDHPPFPSTASNPPVEDAVFFGLVPIDARHTLHAPHNERNAYPGACLAGASIAVPISSFLSDDPSTFDKEVLSKSVLLRTANIIRAEYLKQKEYYGYAQLLAASTEILHMMSMPLKMGLEAARAKNETFEMPPWLDPWYIGDGVAETTIDRVFYAEEKEVLELNDFWVSVNQFHPGPYVFSLSFGIFFSLRFSGHAEAIPSAIR
jgi:hypothetical protein